MLTSQAIPTISTAPKARDASIRWSTLGVTSGEPSSDGVSVASVVFVTADIPSSLTAIPVSHTSATLDSSAVTTSIPSTTTAGLSVSGSSAVSSDGSSGIATTNLVAILVPIFVLFTIGPCIGYIWWRRRKAKACKAKANQRARTKTCIRQPQPVKKYLELDGTGKQELETRAWIQELGGRTLNPDRKELETIEKAQELDGRRKSQKSYRSSMSTLGNLFRKLTTKSSSPSQTLGLKPFEDSSPRDFGQIEAGFVSGMGAQAEVDEELRELRIQQGRALAAREAAEQREAELRRMIAEREGKRKG